ncbi:hypothetical protein CLAFUW4_10217 [Fulvia fulva]|uniref:Uncharacterized protein n=1 Tax=Passalora fulva TaxID=5499 RepID=A0A9Q8P7J4_PASFU|nr:uncharacterized protein CLAFUR5_04831 [Fulvia fulva]KAK4615327.1 hypothetical protein CLAFUR4_10221 [Fulvia fulva]KAK4617374.1 hypothetical protein CLAFUR0_10219 [Fulvia fulva]UJO16184.1 hypothetical protein CLAFUR5_04831 [Fulvia fulva]WPV19309.1 hypothetical protein CLAFUW4_10217 [Fulvia fulva]WPV34602.1 hypothetical protein CLAFUW7_10217 [Fulvia fulva]
MAKNTALHDLEPFNLILYQPNEPEPDDDYARDGPIVARRTHWIDSPERPRPPPPKRTHDQLNPTSPARRPQRLRRDGAERRPASAPATQAGRLAIPDAPLRQTQTYDQEAAEGAVTSEDETMDDDIAPIHEGSTRGQRTQEQDTMVQNMSERACAAAVRRRLPGQ